MGLILNNWKLVFGLILALGAHFLYMAYWVQPMQERALAALETRLNNNCLADKKLTAEAENEHLVKIRDLNRRVDELKRLRGKPAMPASSSSSSSNATKGDVGLCGPHGWASDFYDYARDAEETGIALDQLQTFVKRVWKDNGQ